MVASCDGYIFTDYRWSFHATVDVYREAWMPTNCIGVRGDKGQVARLLNIPTLLFDDKEENIDRVRRYKVGHELNGVVVRRGRKRKRGVEPGYECIINDPYKWVARLRHFTQQHL